MAKRGLDGVLTRSFGARDHTARVTAVEYLTPHFVRIHLLSRSLLADVALLPTTWIRFWFPDTLDPEQEHQRAYTIVTANPETGEFAIDCVLHEPAGPASSWAQQAKPGDHIAVTTLGSTGFILTEDLPAGYLLIGDAASLPAINSILAVIPTHLPVELYLEEHTPEDRQIPIQAHPRTIVNWVQRDNETSLARGLADRDWSNWSAWVACESDALKHVRARLLTEFGFPKTEITARAYWCYGRVFGKKRPKDMPEQPAVSAKTAAAGKAATPATGASWNAVAGKRLLAPLRTAFTVAAIAQALATLLQLAPFVLLVELARQLLAGNSIDALLRLGWWAGGILVTATVLTTALQTWLHLVDMRFSGSLRRRLLQSLGRVPLGFFDARSATQIKQLVHDDTLALHYLTTHAIPDAVAAIVAPITVMVYLFIVDWRLALALMIPVLSYLVGMYIMLTQSGPRAAQAPQWREKMLSAAAAYLDGQAVVRIFGGAAAAPFTAQLSGYLHFLRSWQQPFTGRKTFIDLVTRPATFLFLSCAVGTALITTGAMQPVTLLPFLFLGTTFGARLLGVGYGLITLRDGMLAARRIQVALDEEQLSTRQDTNASAETVANHKLAVDSRHNASTRGLVEFDNVSFAYRPGMPVLSDVSLRLDPGTITALVGPSGSGKSTLASLLARFYDVTAGTICIDGHDLRSYDGDDLYTKVGFVFQSPQLVLASVHDNIALARPDATREEVQNAARAAQIHDRITALPDGYDTIIGADTELSGGERQRLTIARALLADFPILVLDEATAYADPESEYFVQQALSRLTAGRTVLLIAHRLHTITGVDSIVVLERGKIVEQGRHTDLLSQGGRYSQLWAAASLTEVTS